MTRTLTLCNLPQAVPKSTLSAQPELVVLQKDFLALQSADGVQNETSERLTQVCNSLRRVRTASIVVDARLGQHGIVLNLRLTDGRAIVANDH